MRSSLQTKLTKKIAQHRRKWHAQRDFDNRLIARNLSLDDDQVIQFPNVKIAHLTDLHVGRVTPMEAQQATLAATNLHNPDLVLLTGDFVCHSEAFLDDLAYLLGTLKAPKFAVLGNHDYWSGAQGVKRALKRAGVEVLQNNNTVVQIGGESVQLVGLDDPYTGHDDVQKATRGMRLDVPTIGLSHVPDAADALIAHNVPLVLSGHTHAGQITVARINELVLGKLAGHKYIHGTYRVHAQGKSGRVYVNAGIGSAVVPFRLGEKSRREIALFEKQHLLTPSSKSE